MRIFWNQGKKYENFAKIFLREFEFVYEGIINRKFSKMENIRR